MILTYQKPLSGKRVGIVYGSFAPLHQGHLDVIFRAKKENDAGCIVIVCGSVGDKGEPHMKHNERYQYVREFFADDELVSVYAINDTELGIEEYPNGWDGWKKEFDRIWEFAVQPNSLSSEKWWYVGDVEYYKDLSELREKCVLIDRNENPISGTYIRSNPIKHWNKIASSFKRVFSNNILITGTASEGKTTLVKDLGKYFNAPFSHEWARDYMREKSINEWELQVEDYIAFLYGQYRLNESLISSNSNNGIFFSDTDSVVTKTYAEYYCHQKDFFITPEDMNKISTVSDVYSSKSRWNKIFLVAPHGKFVDDHERFLGHSGMQERQEIYDILVKNIKETGDWGKVTILDGGYYSNFKTIKDWVMESVK